MKKRYATIAAALMISSHAYSVGTYDYSDRRAPSSEAPVENPPMLVVLGSDDNYNLEGMEWMNRVLAERKHSDGSNIRMSFYSNTRWQYQTQNEKLFKEFKKSYDMGNEVSSHTASHIMCSAPEGSSKRLSDDAIYAEIQNNISDMEKMGIKKEHMFGFRTPYLALTDSTYTAIKKSEFLYDCSVYEGFNEKPGGYYWPYTLDTKNGFNLDGNGLEMGPSWWDEATMGPKPAPMEPSFAPGNHLAFTYNNYTNRAPIRQHSGLWVLPAYIIVAPDSMVAHLDTAFGYWTGGIVGGTLEDLFFGDLSGKKPKKAQGAAFTKEQALQTLIHHFDNVYAGNRTPLTLCFHTPNFSPTINQDNVSPNCSYKDRQWVVEQFLDYCLTKKDTWIVSGEQAINYCRKPVPADQFVADEYSAIPVATTSAAEPIVKKSGFVTINGLKGSTLSLNIDRADQYRITLFSPSGRELSTMTKTLEQGMQSVDLAAGASGMVLVQVERNGMVVTQKMNLQ